MEMDRISVATIKNGAAVELIDAAIQQVLENVVDPDTDAKTKRSVTLKLGFKPDKDRDQMGVTIDVSTSLAPHDTVGTVAFIAHTRDGVVAIETRQRGLYETAAEPGDAAPVVDIKEGGAK